MPSELPPEDSLESWQRDEFRQCAKVIDETIGSVFRLFSLLETMHDQGIWKSEWDDFADYCWNVWNIPPSIIIAWRRFMEYVEGGK